MVLLSSGENKRKAEWGMVVVENALVQQRQYLRRGWDGRQSMDHSIFCDSGFSCSDSVSEYFCPFIIQNEAR